MTWWSTDEYARLREEILGDFEDDALGVYEVWWTPNACFPERAVSERLALAEAVVAELVAAGIVRLCRGKWIGSGHEGTPVPDGEVAALLREWIAWVPQEGDVAWMDRTR